MKLEKSEILILLSILLLNSLLRFSLVFLQTGFWWDETVYLGLSQNFASKGQYSINVNPSDFQKFYSSRPVIDESFRPPLFPLILSLFVNLGKNFQMIISPLFSIIAIVITFIFSKRLFGARIGILSVVFLSVAPGFFVFSERILTESLFASLTVPILYFMIRSFDDNKLLLVVFGLIAITFLTRYPALIFLFLFFVLAFLKKKLNILISRYFFLSVLLFLLILLPWFYHNLVSYGNILGGLNISLSELNKPYHYSDALFYIRNFTAIFGLSSLFIFFSLKNIRKNEMTRIFLVSFLIVLIAFSILFQRKETRYLVAFSPIFSILFSIGFENFLSGLSGKMVAAIIVLLVLLIADIGSALLTFTNNLRSGEATRLAGEFLKSQNTEYIVGENYPVLNYFSGKKILPFPDDKENFLALTKSYGIEMIVVDNFEPTTPKYAVDLMSDLELVKEFKSDDLSVSILRIPKHSSPSLA